MSAGVARGRVRVAKTFDAARELRPGEVLVATSTTQPWTPLFATAAALVTEAGGVLSHIGVVAREYRLPAVSGVAKAVNVLRDGMLVEVDGSAGIVRIVAEG
ncbi:MAG TPA: PEP-utilizing enzyme [Trueperaceae bacterium]|nr:PEP-utilizing enzyme [Trueperaceae bacterium]